MMNRYFKIGSGLFFLFFLLACVSKDNSEQNDPDVFTFAFLTDIHLQPELDGVAGFKQAIDSVNALKPDFVITGGDLIMDALGQSFGRSDSLYKLYDSMTALFNMPVYHTMGNHEIFGIYKSSGVSEDHPDYGEKLFERILGPRYYSFDHKGWHFMVLDGIEDTGGDGYIGLVDSAQMQWIRNDLETVDPETPVVISVHIPFITVVSQLEYGPLAANGGGSVVNNSKEVLELFKGHNLKLVLQGHLHYIEDIHAHGIHFITGGAVSSRWWGGKYNGMEEGFMLIHARENDFDWEYFDFGWEAEEVDSW